MPIVFRKNFPGLIVTTQVAIVTTLVALGTAHADPSQGQARIAVADTVTLDSKNSGTMSTRKKGEAGEEPERTGSSAAASGVGRQTNNKTRAVQDSHERHRGAQGKQRERSSPTPSNDRIKSDQPADHGANSLERARQQR